MNNQYMSNEKESKKSLSDILFDPDNVDPIELYDDNDKMIRFEQIAVIPGEDNEKDRIFLILQPLIPGIKDDEAMCFEYKENDDGEESLVLVEDNGLCERIFKMYLELREGK